MVGARELGEFAWAVENLLNRVLDNTLTRSPAILEVLRDAIAALPQMIDAPGARQPGDGRRRGDLRPARMLSPRDAAAVGDAHCDRRRPGASSRAGIRGIRVGDREGVAGGGSSNSIDPGRRAAGAVGAAAAGTRRRRGPAAGAADGVAHRRAPTPRHGRRAARDLCARDRRPRRHHPRLPAARGAGSPSRTCFPRTSTAPAIPWRAARRWRRRVTACASPSRSITGCAAPTPAAWACALPI